MIDVDVISKVFLIFVVLQIILFFKVWGMTDNVSKIRKMIENGNTAKDDIKLAVLNGQIKLAQKLAFRYSLVLNKQLLDAQKNSNADFVKDCEKQIDSFVDFCELYELPKPE